MFKDYGYRAWSDIRPGDYVRASLLQPGAEGFTVVTEILPVPPERTLDGSDNLLRVVGRTEGGLTVRAAHRTYHHTTVYYRRAS